MYHSSIKQDYNCDVSYANVYIICLVTTLVNSKAQNYIYLLKIIDIVYVEQSVFILKYV